MPLPTERDTSRFREQPPPLIVLIVDDEPLIRWSLRQAFAERGHQVTTAGTAGEALAAIADGLHGFDVVVLDYRLPDRQDLSLLDDVRRQSPASLVLMMTAFADDGMRSQALDRGARAVVDKPFQVRSFVSMVESAAAE
jgi:DNA-binding NtrC family response regulator